jgi:hypothetical protein
LFEIFVSGGPKEPLASGKTSDFQQFLGKKLQFSR